MALDKRYLKKHGNQWLVIVKVPEKLRPIFGKAHLKHPLHTDSLAIANRDKFKIVAAFMDQIEQAKKDQSLRNKLPLDSITEEAFQWREALLQAQDDPSFYQFEDEHGDVTEDGYSLTRSLLVDRAEEIGKREGNAKGAEFHAVASGTATPILSLVDKWLAEKPMKPRQQTDYRRAVVKFAAWLGHQKLPTTVEGCTRRIAGRYVTEVFVEAGVNPRTANKDISCLSSCWVWFERKGIVQQNIWMRQSLAKQEPKKGEKPREFTDEELRTLFAGNASRLIRDMMTIAALSGMRVEEIAKLTVSDIVKNCFDIPVAKTPSGIRLVPIHSALSGIVSRRTNGKAPAEPLFPELPIPREGSAVERSQKVVKAFTTYRRRMGVDDVSEGARQSKVTFHSFRRWFITKAEQAGREPHFIAVVAGQKREGMTLGLYSGGPLIQQLRDVVEAVTLPTECDVE